MQSDISQRDLSLEKSRPSVRVVSPYRPPRPAEVSDVEAGSAEIHARSVALEQMASHAGVRVVEQHHAPFFYVRAHLVEVVDHVVQVMTGVDDPQFRLLPAQML